MEIQKKIKAEFFKTEQNNEPVRDFLKGLPLEDKKSVGGGGYYGCGNVLAGWISNSKET